MTRKHLICWPSVTNSEPDTPSLPRSAPALHQQRGQNSRKANHENDVYMEHVEYVDATWAEPQKPPSVQPAAPPRKGSSQAWSWFTRAEVQDRLHKDQIHARYNRKRFLKMKSLFGRKKAQPQENPYAQQQTPQQEYDRNPSYPRSQDAGTGPRPAIPGGLPSGPGARRNQGDSPAPAPPSAPPNQGYSSSASTYVESSSTQGYDSARYGSSSGYGSGGSNAQAFAANRNAVPARTGGGYGGLGPSPASRNDQEQGRGELMGGAPAPGGDAARYARQDHATDPNNRYGPGAPPAADPDYEPDPWGANEYANDNEDLTPEQNEEWEFRKKRNEISNMHRKNLDSTERTIAMARQAKERGLNTAGTLHSQGQRLANVEKNLNMSAVHAREAESKTKELNTLNRSMFAVHIENPLTKKKRRDAKDQALVDQTRGDRAAQEAVNSDRYRQKQNYGQLLTEVASPKNPGRYTFDSDEDDPDESEQDKAMKARTAENMEVMTDLAKDLNKLARYAGKEVDDQNPTIERLHRMTDGVSDHVVKNSAKLSRIN